MFTVLFWYLIATCHAATIGLRRHVQAATKPPATRLVIGALLDLMRSKPALIAENALLRQQLIVLKRSGLHPRYTPADRTLLVLLASRVLGDRHC